MKVSVITTTYNHPEWMLLRAIDSVESQKFRDFEHIVMNDNNTHYGMMRNYGNAFKKCTGEYIAFCDGDDYWIDNDKLLKQVKYMDSHPECGLCTTKVITDSGTKRKYFTVSTEYVNNNLCYDSLLKGTIPIFAQSYLIRKSDFDKYIDFEKFIRLGFGTWDLPIVLELIRHTKFHCMDFYSAVFVKNDESVTNTKNRVKRSKYIINTYWIKIWFISNYGCKLSTALYLIYRLIRHIYSITFKRWK